MAAFEAHNAAARKFFAEELGQPSRLLEIDSTTSHSSSGSKSNSKSSNWAAFCQFVGYPEQLCPTGEFPVQNATPESCQSPSQLTEEMTLLLLFVVAAAAAAANAVAFGHKSGSRGAQSQTR